MRKAKMLKVFAVTLVATAAMSLSAMAANFTYCADSLHQMGLFNGTDKGYELDRVPNRGEAAAMLVRLLGKEAEAKKLKYVAPFTDVNDWAKPYVQYLYQNGLTTGTSNKTFSLSSPCTAQQYATFLLRALGYTEKNGDFIYDKALDFAQNKEIVNSINCSSSSFMRDNVVAMSYTALATIPKNASMDLLSTLIANGSVSNSTGASLQSTFANYRAYLAATAKDGTVTTRSQTFTISTDASINGEKALSSISTVTTAQSINRVVMNQSTLASTSTGTRTLYGSLGNKTEITGTSYYYVGGQCYIADGAHKTKRAMSFDAVQQQVGGATAVLPICTVSHVGTEPVNDGTKYSITYAPTALNLVIGPMTQSAGLGSTSSNGLQYTAFTREVVAKDYLTQSQHLVFSMSNNTSGSLLVSNTVMDSTLTGVDNDMSVSMPSTFEGYTLLK